MKPLDILISQRAVPAVGKFRGQVRFGFLASATYLPGYRYPTRACHSFQALCFGGDSPGIRMECCVCGDEIDATGETETESVVDHFDAEHGLGE